MQWNIINKKKLSITVTTSIKIKCIFPNERSQTVTATYWIIPVTWYSGRGKYHTEVMEW